MATGFVIPNNASGGGTSTVTLQNALNTLLTTEGSDLNGLTEKAIRKILPGIETITQTGHGFVPGNVLYNDGTEFKLAQADAEDHVGRYVVFSITDSNTFNACSLGRTIIVDATFASKVIAGHYYMTHAVTPGDFIDTIDPITDNYLIRNILFMVRNIDGNVVTIEVLPWRADMGEPIVTYIFTYTAAVNGSLTGDVEQLVNEGTSGTPITAVPDSGFMFSQWSDGNTDNPRQDINAAADINVTAEFVVAEYTLTYNAGTGGSVTGTTPQQVLSGNDGSPVTAVPDFGYVFDQWDDGITSNPRTDTNVTTDITVSATFKEALYPDYIHGGTLYTSPYKSQAFVNANDEIIMFGDLPSPGGVNLFSAPGVDWGPVVVDQPTTEVNDPTSHLVKMQYTGWDMFALYSNGNLYFRGYNAYGCAGLNNTNAQSTFVLVNTNVKDVECSSNTKSYYHWTGTHIIKDVGGVNKLFGTGYNSGGGLGDGTADQYRTTWVDVTPVGVEVAAVYCNTSYQPISFFISTTGEVYGTGWNNQGQLGVGDTTPRYTFTKIVSLVGENVIKIQSKTTNVRNSTWFLTESGNIYGCGLYDYHEFNQGLTANQSTPVLAYDASISGVKATNLYSGPGDYGSIFYVDENTNLYAIGFHGGATYDALGINSTANAANVWTPVDLPFDGLGKQQVKEVFLINANDSDQRITGYVVTYDNRMFSWGYNNVGQAGDGTTVTAVGTHDITTAVAAAINIGDITQVLTKYEAGDTGYDIMVQVKYDVNNPRGDIFGWGSNLDKDLDPSATAYYSSIKQVYANV